MESKPTPKVYPPDPYDENGSIIWRYDADTDSVIIPYWYWEKIFDYIIDTQAVQKLNDYKDGGTRCLE